jgi:CheY-like chemotaxis protein
MNNSKLVLLVEDESDLRMVLKNELLRVGVEVIEAENGKQGLDLAVEKKPKIILLDVVMPVMDGITMLRELRLNYKMTDIKVILLTNLSDITNVAGAMALGADGYFVKSNESLKDIVSKVLEYINNEPKTKKGKP